MANVNKKKPSSGGSNTHAMQREDVLQGVVLGDSFDRRFAPITLDKPRTLLPLVNIPLLNYTLELLASGGVQQIFVLCCAHADQIKEFISTSRWSSMPGVQVKTIVNLMSKSTGDALRHLNDLDLIHSDFILISGDVISNMKLSNALKVHKERREKDKNIIMTMVFKQASPSHRTRSKQDDIVVGFDKETSQLVLYENQPEERKVSLPIELYEKHHSISLRYDLIDCHIDICAPEVLEQFGDSYDYDDIRKDFIPQTMHSELLDYKLSTYILQGEYAARVKDLRTYNSVSKDIIHRWTFPMVPDNNFMCNTTYTLSRKMIYKEKNVIFRNCEIGEETVFGKGTVVGDNSTVSHSIIGRNVKIGNNVRIYGSYLWDNVIIEDGATVNESLVCENAIVKSHATVSRGSIISFGVVVGDNAFIPEFTKITKCDPKSNDEFESNPTEKMSAKELGENGVGRKWTLPNVYELVDPIGPEVEPSETDTDTDTSGTDTETETDEHQDYAKFKKEVIETVRIGIKENHTMNNIVIQVNGLKFAYDRDFIDCAAISFQEILNVPNRDSLTKNQLVAAFKQRITHFQDFLVKYLSMHETQVDFIFKIQDMADEVPAIRGVFSFILHSLYENDLLTEEAILEWKEDLENDKDQSSKQYLDLCSGFLTWLCEAEEEDESDDDDDDSDD